MKNVTLRLIYPPSMEPHTVKAASAGLKEFTRFGALVETMAAEAGAFENARHAVLLRKITYADNLMPLDPVLKERCDDYLNVFGIALTAHPIVRSDNHDPVLSAGAYLKCAAVSLDGVMRLPVQMRMPALGAIVRYEAARIFIPETPARIRTAPTSASWSISTISTISWSA